MARGDNYRRFMRGRGKLREASVAAGDRPSRRTRIMFAVPAGDGRVNWSIAHQIGRMMWNSAQPDCPFTFATVVLPCMVPVQYARNRIVAQFLASDCDWLIMVDSDQVIPDNFWEMTQVVGADVVSGMTHCWVGTGPEAARVRVNQYGLVKREGVEYPECYSLFPDKSQTAPYMVQVVGTGCVAIRRHVLEALGPNPFRFTYKADGSIQAGEDVNFSSDLGALGFNIVVHPGVRFGHVKSVDLSQVAAWGEASHEFRNAGGQFKPEEVLSIGA